MNIDVIFNKKKHRINIHKLDSILHIKNIINHNILNEQYNLEDIQLYYNNNLLKNNDYCDKLKINNYSNINVHLKKRGGGFMKKIIFYISCLIIIFIPVIILPTGLNTGGATFISEIMIRAKDEFARYLLCDLQYETLTKRFSVVISIIKFFLVGLATYVLISIGCITACCLTKGLSIKDDPNKLCKPFEIGTLAGLVMTVIYFMIYFVFRYVDKFFIPLIEYSKKNYITNLIIRPIFLEPIYKIIHFLKFMVVYIIPYIGQGTKALHSGLDLIFPGLLMVSTEIAKVGCTKLDMKALKNGLMKQIKNSGINITQGMIPSNALNDTLGSIIGNNNNNGANNNNNNGANNNNNGINGNNLNNLTLENVFKIDIFNKIKNNGIINNSKYDMLLERLRLTTKVTPYPLCKTDPEGSCCRKETILTIADSFYQLINSSFVEIQMKDSGSYLGINLALIGLYEKVLYGDEEPLNFENKTVLEKKVLLKKYFEDHKKDLFSHNASKTNRKLGLDIEKILTLQDTIFEERNSELNKIKEAINIFIHKNDLKNDKKIIEIQSRIIELEEKNKQYAEEKNESYIAGNPNDPSKILVKEFFINFVCNFFTTAQSFKDIVSSIGDMNELIDILKSGSATGVIMIFIYIIVIIVLIICGFFGIY